jgi:hypothetical protein
MHVAADQTSPKRRDPAMFIWVFGVFLPAAAILFESLTGMCRSMFFDPLPTPFHTALFATIPLANWRLLRALARGEPALPAPWAWLHAFSYGVAIIYSIVFLPVTPFAVIGTLFFGLGLLGLAPLMAMVCALRGRAALDARAGRASVLGLGIALALAAFLAIDAPSSLTAIGVRMASDAGPDARLRGIKLLRAVGSEDALLRFCYGQGGRGTDMLGHLVNFGRNVSPEQARAVFYQVTGEAFNSRPAPVARRRGYDIDDMFERDIDRGGEVVGGRAEGVALASSRIDGSLDTHAALAYMEWTMELRNSSSSMQEGRAELTLPPGAVVSRATLWINGEEREAAFGGRSEVRQAYEAVVKQKRDPLLVTTAGADRVLVQMFPIPAGGEMKIRLGITAPMTADGADGVRLQLPAFSERNFEIAPELRHAVWFESATPIAGSAGLAAEAGPDGLSAVRGQLPEASPGQPGYAIASAGVRPAALVWSLDDKNKDGMVIVQTRSKVAAAVPGRVALVIDGSRGMQPAMEQLVEALSAFPREVELALVFAGDDAPVLFHHDRKDLLATRRFLREFDFVGGRDNSAALGEAWDWASQAQGAVLWIHGPQPVALDHLETLTQRFERRAGQVALYEVAALAGPNVLAQRLDGTAGVVRVARYQSLADDLRRQFAQWQPGATRTVVRRERRAPEGIVAAKTSPHLARLWAAGQVATLSEHGGSHADAVALASRYQLVTPVSGAVVLETRQDYAAAGLEPVAPGSVPTIPEPETWALMIVALLALLWRRKARAS